MKAENLKKAILQYAMQGKLVEQNPNDEPASELLKRIKAQKEELIKQGKIKKEKPLPPISQDEIPFELPKGWEWVRLRNVGTSNIGLTYKPTDITNTKKGIPVLRSSNIQNDKINLNDLIRVTTEIKSENLFVQQGDILICARNGSKNLVGKAAIIEKLDEPMTFGAFMAIFRSDINNWIKVYLISPLFKQTLESVSTVTINQITQNNLKNAIIPIPPFLEQQRIVEKLEEIFPLVEEYGKNKEELEKLNKTLPSKIKQSILQHAVQGKLVPQNPNDEPASELLKRIKAEKEELIKQGKIKKEKPMPPITQDEIPFELPKGWEWTRLGEIVNYGATGSLDYSEELDKNMWILDLEDIEKVSSKLLIKNRIKDKSFNSTKKCFQKGDVLYGKLRPYLDKVIVADENGICTTEILPLRVYADLNPYYLRWVLKSPTFLQYVNQLTYGVKMPRLGTEDGKNALIPLPPLAEQQRIVDKVEELIKICGKLGVK